MVKEVALGGLEPNPIPAPSRVLMTTDTVGGVWSYCVDLCRALAFYGVRVSLATMGAPLRQDQRAAVDAVPNVDLFQSAYKLEWMEHPWEDVEAAGAWLLDIERQVQPDVVHLNGYAHGCLAWQTPVLIAAHSCVYSWYEAVRGSSPSAEWARYRAEVTRGLRCADLVTAPTQTMMQALSRHYGPFKSGPVVYNGRRAEDFLPGPKQSVILTAGRIWDEAKNVRLLDRVAPRIPWPIYVAGDVHHPDGYGEAVVGGLRPLGRLTPEQMAVWMGRASIYVLPARYEPFGLSALEAALAGCTLVLGDIPSLREVWGDAALYVAPDDAEALEGTLNLLIENEGFRLTCAHRSRVHALQYSSERAAEGYLGLYRVLAARGSPCPV